MTKTVKKYHCVWIKVCHCRCMQQGQQKISMKNIFMQQRKRQGMQHLSLNAKKETQGQKCYHNA